MVGGLFLLVAELAFGLYQANEREETLIELEKQAQISSQLIQEAIMKKAYAVDAQIVILEITDYDAKRFNQWAPIIYKFESGIGSIQLAPDGIIEYIYPLAGNEDFLGFDLYDDAGNKEEEVIDELVFVGPLPGIVKDEDVLICRRPVFKEDNEVSKLWGYSIVVIFLDDFDFYDMVNGDKYHYRIISNLGGGEEGIVVHSNTSMNNELMHVNRISIPGIVWKLEMEPKQNATSTSLHVFFVGLALLAMTITYYIDAQIGKQAEEIIVLNQQLKDLSLVDELTGCNNRRYFNNALDIEMNQANRYALPLAAILIDVDRFKIINDQYGHSVGDDVIVEIANAIKNAIRKSDILARWGGDEFIVLLPNTTSNEAKIVAEKLRKIVNKLQHISELDFSISLGVTEYIRDESFNNTFARMDKALYLVKEKGGNHVEVILR